MSKNWETELNETPDDENTAVLENMTQADIAWNVERLRTEGTASFQHAAELEMYGRLKFGDEATVRAAIRRIVTTARDLNGDPLFERKIENDAEGNATEYFRSRRSIREVTNG